jgi:hypothetical protein
LIFASFTGAGAGASRGSTVLGASAADAYVGGINDVNGLDFESDNYKGTRRAITVGEGQGPLAALAAGGLNAQQQRAMYGQLVRSGQIHFSGHVPVVQPGQTLYMDLADESSARLGGRLIAGESGTRQALAEAAQRSTWDAAQVGAWSGRTGTGGPVWHVNDEVPFAMRRASSDTGYPTDLGPEWGGYAGGDASGSYVARSLGAGVGIAETLLGGAYNGVMRVAGGAMSTIPYAIGRFDVDGAVAFQQRFSGAVSYESRSPGARDIAEVLSPIGAYMAGKAVDARRAWEPIIGDAGVTAAGVVIEAGLEVSGSVSSLRGLRGVVGDVRFTSPNGLYGPASGLPIGAEYIPGSLRPGHSFQLSDPQSKYPRIVLTPEIEDVMGSAPDGMRYAHRHHILDVNGQPGPQRALVREGQGVLREYGIDPMHGAENLVWAPNRGHTIANTEALVRDLQTAKMLGFPREKIVEILRNTGIDAQRR